MSEISCFVCHTDENKTIATFNCNTCDPPRPLCDECASQHRKHLRGHQINKRMPFNETLPSKHPNVENTDVVHPCFLCLRVNKISEGTFFCNNCHNLEGMCYDCAYQHTRQKMTRDHEVYQTISAPASTSPNEKNNSQEMDDAMSKGDTDLSDDEKYPEISIPGEPVAINCEDDRVELQWTRPDDNFDQFRIRYRKVDDEESSWEEIEIPYADDSPFTISNLIPDTQYYFQVKGILEGREGEYSLSSEPVLTNPSLAQKMCAHCTMDDGDDPKVFELPTKVFHGTEDENLKVRKILLGGHMKAKSTTYERSILMLGKTRSGKSTMIEAFINYILGVKFNDKFRFTVKLKKDRKRENGLTVYTLQPFDGSKITYKLNFIDTPGFLNDFNENEAMLKQLSFLFSADGISSLNYLDCVCIILKEKELLHAHKLERSFQNILSLIGKDLEANICILTTFSSAKSLPVLKAISDHQFPLLGSFNNSVLFSDNSQTHSKNDISSQWDMGWKGLKRFFNHFETLTRKSVSITRDLLVDREQIESHLCEMKRDLSSIFEVIVKQEEKNKVLNKQKEFLELCKDFKYEKKESKMEQHEIAKGHHSVYCPACQNTCNEDCDCTESSATAKCPIIGSSSNCTVCEDKCPLAFHAKLDFNLKHVEKTIETTNEKLKNVFDKVTSMNSNIEEEISKLSRDISGKYERLVSLLRTIAKLKNRSEINSIYPFPKPVDWPIVQIIEAEEILKLEGFQSRIEAAKELQEKLQKFCSLKRVLN